MAQDVSLISSRLAPLSQAGKNVTSLETLVKEKPTPRRPMGQAMAGLLRRSSGKETSPKMDGAAEAVEDGADGLRDEDEEGLEMVAETKEVEEPKQIEEPKQAEGPKQVDETVHANESEQVNGGDQVDETHRVEEPEPVEASKQPEEMKPAGGGESVDIGPAGPDEVISPEMASNGTGEEADDQDANEAAKTVEGGVAPETEHEPPLAPAANITAAPDPETAPPPPEKDTIGETDAPPPAIPEKDDT